MLIRCDYVIAIFWQFMEVLQLKDTSHFLRESKRKSKLFAGLLNFLLGWPIEYYTLPTDQLFNLEFQFESVFNLEIQTEFGIQLGIPIPMGIHLGECSLSECDSQFMTERKDYILWEREIQFWPLNRRAIKYIRIRGTSSVFLICANWEPGNVSLDISALCVLY